MSDIIMLVQFVEFRQTSGKMYSHVQCTSYTESDLFPTRFF